VSIYPWGQYWAKLQTQAASGLAPDVISLYSGNMGVWVEYGALLKLDDLIHRFSIDLEAYFPAALKPCLWKDSYYCMPYGISSRALAFSVARLQEQDIPRQQWPQADKAMSWDEFKVLSERLTLRNDRGEIVRYGMGVGYIWNNVMFRMYGGNFTDTQVNPRCATVAGNEPLANGIVEVFKAQYGNRSTLGSIGLFTGAAGNLDTLIVSPKFAMCTSGPWSLIQIKNAGVDFGLAPMPQGPVPSQLIHVNSLGIFHKSRHPIEAFTLIQFMMSAEAQSMMARKLSTVPVLKSSVEYFIKNDHGIKGCEAFIADLEYAEPEVISANSYIITEFVKWGNTTEQILSDEYDRRASLLRKNQKITGNDYNAFAADMDEFVEKTIHSELPALQSKLENAFVKTQVQTPSFMVRVIWPAVVVMILVMLGGYYLVMLNRTKSRAASYGLDCSGLFGYICISPWLLGFAVFALIPILSSIVLSFTDWNMIGAPRWVGFQNYLSLVSDDYFMLGLKTTCKYALLAIPISLLGGLVTAGLLTCDVRCSGLFKAAIYFPALFTDAAAAVLWINMFQKDQGVVNRILSFFAISPINWLDATHAFYTVIMMNFFWIGGSMIIYYAGMKQIPRSLYEAATIDGAGPVRKFISITIPMLSPVILFMVIITTIGAFQVFTPALFFATDSSQIGSPGDSLRFYSVNIYNEAFNNLRMGRACAYAMVLFVIIFAVTVVQRKIARKIVHTEAPL
jgi:multiple sugar transport system permease protein